MARFTKLCKCCGLPFETNSPQKLFCDREHYLPCPVCGKPVKKKDRDFTRPATCCSIECTIKKHDMNLPYKKCEICGEMFKVASGIATICNKEHHVPCEICGKDMIVTKTMWHDKITTCSKECAKEKLRRFYQDKYGVDHPMQNSEVQKHHRAAMKAKYGAEHALQIPQFLEQAYNTNLERFGTKYACLREECRSVSPMPLISSYNKIWGKLVSGLGYEVEYEKQINSRLFDIYIKELNTVLEIDPTYTHNSLYNHWDDPLDKDYHKKKSDIALSEGIRCIHVFDWDPKEKILEIIRPKTKIGARKCKVKEVDTTECNKFLRENHLQGSLYKQSYRIGLYYNDELVQIMTFGKPRYDKQSDIELLRLCTKSRISIIGGANKLFNYAMNANEGWNSIISYCDLAKFTGQVYTKLGMKLKRITPPQAVWSKGSDKITSMLLRQRGFDQLFGTHHGKGTSNEQLMIDDGWLPVYDCGQAVYVYSRGRSNEEM